MTDTTPHSMPEEALENLHLTLEGMGRLGEALAQHDGQVVYVSGGISGEEVVAQVVRRRRRYIVAQVIEVLKPSPHRVEPPCRYFGPCSGCQWQHIDYSHQLELKRRAVQTAIDRVPVLEGVPVRPTLSSPQVLHYRNHARFTIGPEGSLGFVNRTTRRFVPIDRCILMHPWINDALEQLQGRCGETTQLSVRYGVNNGNWLIQPTLQNPDIPLRSGQPHYEEVLLGKTFRIAASSFFQVNTRLAEILAEMVRDRLHLSGRELLVDAYAGVGTFSVLLAPYVRRCIAIEESASAVKDAAINSLGLGNIDFRQSKAEEVLSNLEGPEETPDAVILDPPRTGCHPKVLEALIRLSPGRVAYVSCEPETLARDLGILRQGPFTVEEVQPLDMFPQTHHVECLAILSLGRSSAA